MKTLLNAKEDFTAKLLAWFAVAGRPLPWRNTYDPYEIWVSEVMLQQTQAERGARFFVEWMRRFPTLRSVAEADLEAVLAAWEGLGYYSRAKNLHRAAKYIMDVHGGRFPDSLELLRALPGVGEYTAGAVASIAFNLPTAAVDTNIRRLLARLGDLALPLDDPKAKSLINETALALIPAESPRLFNQALMELGALLCVRKPRCGQCPVAEHCLAHRLGATAERPLPKVKKAYQALEMLTVVIQHRGRVLIRQRPPQGLWANLWEFPGGPLENGENPAKAALRLVREQTGLTAAAAREIAVLRHGYTSHRVTLHCYFCEAEGGCSATVEGLWQRPEELAGRAFPAGHRKLMEHLGWKIERP